jgi:hypothetical protein
MFAFDMFLAAIPAFRIPARGNVILIRRVTLAARRQVLRFTPRRFARLAHVAFHVGGVPMNVQRTGAPESEWSSNRSFRGKARSVSG